MELAFVFMFGVHPAPVGPVPPDGRDRWFARDKVLHFTASMAIQGAAHLVLKANGATYAAASRGAAVATLTAGVGKEVWDMRRGGDPSWRDLAWDAVGGAAGATVMRQADRRPDRTTVVHPRAEARR